VIVLTVNGRVSFVLKSDSFQIIITEKAIALEGVLSIDPTPVHLQLTIFYKSDNEIPPVNLAKLDFLSKIGVCMR
jgi:hypothetical protein